MPLAGFVFPRSEMVAYSPVRVHYVGAWVDWDSICVRKMKIAPQAETQIEPFRQPGLHAKSRLQTEVLISRVVRNRLLGKDDHSPLEEYVRLDDLVVSPHHAQADRRNPHTGHEFPLG